MDEKIEIINEDEICDYNDGVACVNHTKCDRCGWCPTVEAERKERIRKERQ